MTTDQIKEFLLSTFKLGIETETDEEIIFTHFEYRISLKHSELLKIINELDADYSKDETELYRNNYYEILTQESTRVNSFRFKEQELIDEVNGITYSYGMPTDHYTLFVLSKILNSDNGISARRYFDIYRFKRMRSVRRDINGQLELFNVSVLEFLKESISRLNTLKIVSTRPITKSLFEQYAYSFLFTLSYNLSLSIYPLRFFDEFLSTLRIGRFSRTSIEELEPPKRLYINDLILYYQKGISSESIDHQFLSFYHIIEHFFEKIYNEDLLGRIRSELTKPGFSYKKKNDIETLVKIIQNRLKIKNDEFEINELEALELTLRKYVLDFNEVKAELNEVSETLLNYYRTTEVPFCKGNKVNFDSSAEETYKNLAKRIYYTRNSIVHSKETEKLKYTPFKDDKDLISEIYLMRIITEKIIIANSKEI